ncbi:MAG: ribonuclease HI [Dehalococcoidia bacterium]|nr:ribonuclease HI [Dehalococcoidia bacterium]
MEQRLTETVAYTDGSSLGNPGRGGWGVHIEFSDGRILELGGGEAMVTNNQMELRAAIEALRATRDEAAVLIYTDSTYVRKGITEWVANWKRSGWKTRQRDDVKNIALWQELDELQRPGVTWEYVQAHVGIAGNERADAIALWFAQGVGMLGSERITPSRPRSTPTTSNTRYLSLVDGILERHRAWTECERRVRNVRGARYKKVNSREEELEVVRRWGLRPEEIDALDVLNE